MQFIQFLLSLHSAIKMLYFHNSFQYIVHTKISYLRSKKLPASRGCALGPRWGHSPRPPSSAPRILAIFPQTNGVWIKPCSQTHSSRSSDLWPQDNKSAQSNFGRRPRRCESLHVRRKVPTGYNGAPQIRPQKYRFPWTDPQTPLPASSMDPSDLRCQTASISDPPFSTMHWTDRRADRQVVHGKVWWPGRSAPRATRSNNR